MTDAIKSLQLATITLKDFRCFDHITIDLNNAIVFIYGLNGTGKTSILEALYYACYLRSFRTHNSKELIALSKSSFFIQLTAHDIYNKELLDHTISIGFSSNKKLVKINNKPTVSYKDLLSYYRVVSLTEDDLMLIKGAPEERRLFIDQALLLNNHNFIVTIKEFRTILENRNALLQHERIDQEAYFIWTQKLWECTRVIRAMRIDMLKSLEHEINTMLVQCFSDDISLSFSYQSKKNSDLPFDSFWSKNNQLLKEEVIFKRSLFGIHLDDFSITLEGKKTRSYASRGQQKMVVLLIKAAQIKQLTKEKGPVIFLLDDFMTDFDAKKSVSLLTILLTLNCQLIFTSPHSNSPLEWAFKEKNLNYKTINMQ
jgi:DNA replication and repair protein RecF